MLLTFFVRHSAFNRILDFPFTVNALFFNEILLSFDGWQDIRIDGLAHEGQRAL